MLNRLFFGVVSTAALPFALIYALTNRKLRQDLSERFLGGGWRGFELDESIWIHAASVGEMQGVIPLLSKIKAETSTPIIITTTSITGRDKAASLPGVERALLLPYDHALTISLAIQKINPKIFLLFETELWPNTLLQLKKAKIPAILINGRISDKAFPKYLKIARIISPILSALSQCLVQSEKDRSRFQKLGASKIKVEGNTKYDTQTIVDPKEVERLKDEMKIPDPAQLLVCGSIRPGESEIIFKAFKRLSKQFPLLRLLIAPRHPEQFAIEAKRAVDEGFNLSRRTNPKENCEVFLLDSLGELKTAYAASTISFVGGTLVDIGGHNPMEPALFSKPILLGPYTQNVEEICAQLEEGGGALIVEDVEDIETTVKSLLSDSTSATFVGKKAFEILNTHSGAVKRVFEEIEEFLHRKPQKLYRSASLLLKPAEFIYSSLISLRNGLYDNRILPAYKSSLPVVCVGNVTVGGNAKSPVTQAIARILKIDGLEPVILLRGYRGKEIGPKEVLDPTDIKNFGDEACMHKLELPDIPVVVSRKRSDGAKYIEKNSLGNIIVMDDGFQHRALERVVDLLLFDQNSIVQASSGRMLPAGRLREKLTPALKRASAICLVERENPIVRPDWIPSDKPTFTFSLKLSDLTSIDQNKTINWSQIGGHAVSAIATIAKPSAFKKMLEAKGLIVKSTLFKSDHANWTAKDIEILNSLPGEFIITTAKDRIKLRRLKNLPEQLLVGGLTVELSEDFKSWLGKLIGQSSTSAKATMEK